jgi:uncharacterized protein
VQQPRSLQRGIGLRALHVGEVLSAPPADTWFEVISENFLGESTAAVERLLRVRRNHDIALHGVAMYIGSAEPLNMDYLAALKCLIRQINPVQVSDHLCWGSVNGNFSHDLLPLPMTLDIARYVADKIRIAQDFLEVQLAIENVSSYAAFRASTLHEWDFLMEVATRADCRVLMDINNITVSAHNHGFDPREYIDAIDPARVAQLHLAGFLESEIDGQTFRLDTHSRPVSDETWDLYQYATKKIGPVPTLIEWDSDIPSLQTLLEESSRALELQSAAVDQSAASKYRMDTDRGMEIENINPPSDLQSTTKTFFATLRQPLQSESRVMAGLLDSSSLLNHNLAHELVNDTARLRAASSVETYHQQYWFRLLESLEEDFPVLRFVVGNTEAKRIFEAYLAKVGATHYCLTELGRGLGQFCAQLPAGALSRELPPAALIAELVELEFAMLIASNGRIDAEPARWLQLAHDNSIAVASSVTLLELSTNALAVYRDALRGRARTLTARQSRHGNVAIVCSPSSNGAKAHGVATGELRLLQSLLEHSRLEPFAEYWSRADAAELTRFPLDFPGFVSRCFSRWSANGWLQ